MLETRETTRPAQMETARLEAFSDGVFAVAITLLALNLTFPQARDLPRGHGLADALLRQWPIYLAYALSFLTILIMWVNHHRIFQFIRRTDHSFLLMNGLLLMVITAIPFVTALLAAYLQHPDKRIAEIVYSGASLVMATTYNRMWWYASRGGRLLDPAADQVMVQGITRQYRFGPLLYLVAFLTAFLSAEVSLALCILLAIVFALPTSVARSE